MRIVFVDSQDDSDFRDFYEAASKVGNAWLIDEKVFNCTTLPEHDVAVFNQPTAVLHTNAPTIYYAIGGMWRFGESIAYRIWNYNVVTTNALPNGKEYYVLPGIDTNSFRPKLVKSKTDVAIFGDATQANLSIAISLLTGGVSVKAYGDRWINLSGFEQFKQISKHLSKSELISHLQKTTAVLFTDALSTDDFKILLKALSCGCMCIIRKGTSTPVPKQHIHWIDNIVEVPNFFMEHIFDKPDRNLSADPYSSGRAWVVKNCDWSCKLHELEEIHAQLNSGNL